MIETLPLGLLFPGGVLPLLRLRRRRQGIRETGQYRVCGNPVTGVVVRGGSHESNDAHLRRDVVAHAGDGYAAQRPLGTHLAAGLERGGDEFESAASLRQ
jgi:hypothetical protein